MCEGLSKLSKGVAAIKFRSHPFLAAELRDLAKKGKIAVFVCQAIFAEVAGGLRKKFGTSGRTDFEPQRIPVAIEPETIGCFVA